MKDKARRSRFNASRPLKNGIERSGNHDPASGQFTRGNKAAVGRSAPTFAQRTAKLKRCFYKVVDDEEFTMLVRAIVDDAKAGSRSARAMVLRYLLGLPRPADLREEPQIDAQAEVLDLYERAKRHKLVYPTKGLTSEYVSVVAGLMHYVSLNDAAALVGCSGDTLRRLMLQGRSLDKPGWRENLSKRNRLLVRMARKAAAAEASRRLLQAASNQLPKEYAEQGDDLMEADIRYL